MGHYIHVKFYIVISYKAQYSSTHQFSNTYLVSMTSIVCYVYNNVLHDQYIMTVPFLHFFWDLF